MIGRKLVEQVKGFLKDERVLFKDVSFVFSGKLFVVVLGFFLTPIIARLYLPEDYGEFALYNMVVQNIVVVGTLSLPMAVSTVKMKDLPQVFSLSISVILFFTIIFGIVLFAFDTSLDSYFSTNIFTKYWYIMLISFSVTSLVSTLAGLNIQLRRFKLNTAVSVTEATVAKSLNLVGGWMSLKALGLIVSDAVSKVISLSFLVVQYPKSLPFAFAGLRTMKRLLIKFKKYPLFLMPSQWIGTISNQLIIWLAAYQFSKTDLGQLSMAIALLGIPLNVLSNSFQPVITQRMVMIRDGEESDRFFEKMALILFALSIVCFTTIYMLPASFFTWFLGDKWDGIDVIIKIYCWYYLLLFLDQAFQNGFVVFNKQREKLIFNIIDVILLLVAAYISISVPFTFQKMMILFVGIKMIISASRIFYLWKITKI